MINEKNKLYVIPTPIGNLDDITLRAIKTLKDVKYIFCEDTLVSQKLKKHLDLSAKLFSLYKYNEKSKFSEVRKFLSEGDVALISDAGTPTISDPGQFLIEELKDEYEIIPLPGANAITTALSASGLLFNNFSFVGFLPKEQSKLLMVIDNYSNTDVIVCFESPNRINKTLELLLNNYGDIKVVVARELTKMYEEIKRDKISNLVSLKFKGEIVLIIETKDIQKKDSLKEMVDYLLDLNVNEKVIISFLKEKLNYKKNDVYNYLKKNKKY